MSLPTEIQETMNRIQAAPGVIGTIMISPNTSEPVSTFNTTDAGMYSKNVQVLMELASSAVRDIDPEDEMQFLRIHTAKLEIMAARETDFLAIVLQKLNSE